MTKTVIVYHSGYGHTQRVAQAVAEGAGAGAELVAVDAEGNVPAHAWEKLDAADAIILGSPTYMGGVSWQFKKFVDASSKPWGARAWQDKIFGGFTNSASMIGDKQVTMSFLQTFALQHGGIWVSLGLLPSNTKASKRTDINSTGAFAGVMTQTPADASVEEMSTGDLETAKAYGQRIAAIAARFGK